MVPDRDSNRLAVRCCRVGLTSAVGVAALLAVMALPAPGGLDAGLRAAPLAPPAVPSAPPLELMPADARRPPDAACDLHLLISPPDRRRCSDDSAPELAWEPGPRAPRCGERLVGAATQRVMRRRCHSTDFGEG